MTGVELKSVIDSVIDDTYKRPLSPEALNATLLAIQQIYQRCLKIDPALNNDKQD